MNQEISAYGLSLPNVQVRRKRPWPNIILFVLTFATTTLAGAIQTGVNPIADPWQITSGLPFALTLMTILLVHEMGHYVLARYHGVRATLPYFIPAPSLIGTLGAFIKMESPPENRRSLFDVGIAGPLAGLALAIPAVIVGLRLSTVSVGGGADGSITLGSSILLRFLSEITLGLLPDEADIVMHPIGFAGWIGLFVTALNLLPIGQLDGGHVAYALFGRRQIWVSRAALVFILALGLLRYWEGWLLWGGLLLLMGVRHPPPLDADTPLDLKRKVAGWAAIAIFVLTFVPAPFSIQRVNVLNQPVAPKPIRKPVEFLEAAAGRTDSAFHFKHPEAPNERSPYLASIFSAHNPAGGGTIHL
jgi:membrane-associated protease RseP (regulator of RpoE activity)